MAVRGILTWPDARLSEVAGPVVAGAQDVRDLAQDLLETMYDAKGRGLAAPQIGVSQRVFVMDATWKTGAPRPQVFVNPEITSRGEDPVTGPEGCLSIPGITVPVTRAHRIEVAWSGLDGSMHQAAFDGFAAVCIQHEVDHLDGVVTFDRLSPSDRAVAERDYRELDR